MRAHKRAGEIPDPHVAPTSALKVLREYPEIMENPNRFLQLTKEDDAKSTLTSAVNLKVFCSQDE